MQTTVSINNLAATVTIEHTGEKDRVLATLEQAGLYAFNHGFYSVPEGTDPSTITWESLKSTKSCRYLPTTSNRRSSQRPIRSTSKTPSRPHVSPRYPRIYSSRRHL